ncbi:MAG: hypothetical protein UY40_C0002G0043 [candidate division CPR1 bacterium GW2011_GWC1_49_13]|uniref:Uncharacterized protein n=1 Tax=candidate division CPR1 bacterium GW2011_GWC1_49_13 TaxID=1618342 RepID=A0A0G1VI57_9BACT|nr:MAG: hypothetical protein UY40_C0002G0043 [candidate division CPR1 bacterium GW2011_GWC1_49_13]
MPKEKLILLLRVANYWKKPQMESTAAEFFWVCDSLYRFLKLADISAIRYSEIVDGEDLLAEGIDAEVVEAGIQYFCVWEVPKDSIAEEEPAPPEENAEENTGESEDESVPLPPPQIPEDNTGQPALTSDDIDHTENDNG